VYTPWANSTIERACKEVLRAVRTLLSEFRLRPAEWPVITNIVQAALNNTLVTYHVNVAPLTAFTGIEVDSPLPSLFFGS
jgi:hypothetical protein